MRTKDDAVKESTSSSQASNSSQSAPARPSGGSRDSSAHAAASADRTAAASRGKVTKFTPSTRGGAGTTNRGNVGSSTAANNMGGQGAKNRYQWNQGFESQHHFGGTEDFDKMAANLSVPTDYEDRNFHFFIPNGNANKDFLTEASEKNIDRSLWSASEVYKDLDREYNSPEERRENLRDWMYHAQVYYKHALDNNYTFTDNDGNEVKVADVWKDIYDQLAYDDEFGSYINGGPDPWSAGLTQNKIKQAQANYDAAQTDEERERWQLTIQELSNTDYRAISNNYKQAYDMYMSGGEVDLDSLRANAQALDYHAQLYGDSEEANDFIALRNAVNGLADSVEKDINRSHYEEAQKQLEQLKTENKAIKVSGAGLSDYDEGYDEFLRQNALNEKQQAELEQQMAGLNDELFEKFASDPVKEARYRLEHPREYEKYKHEHGLMLKQEQELHEQDQAMVDQFMASIGVAPQYYNFVDRATGAVHSGVYGIAGSVVDLASLAGRTARDLDAYGDANPDGEVDFFAWDKAQTERRNQTKQLMAAYDMTHGENAYAKDFGHFLDVEDAMTENSELESRREELLGTVGDDGVVSDELSRELDAIDKKLKENKKQIKEWQKEDALNGISDETVLGKITELGNYLDYMEGSEISKAIQGAGTAEKYFMLGTKNALEMGFDTGVAFLTGGGSQVASLSSMFARILGKSAAEVNRAGGTLTQGWLYGLGNAGLEVGTELIGGTFNKIGYSRGLTSDLGEKVVALMADTPRGRMAVRIVENACEEMGEEWVSNKLSPLLDKIYRDESLKELAEEEYAETATDCILGFFMGAAYSVIDIPTGGAAQFNYESYQADLQSDAKKTHDLFEQQQAEAVANAAPKSSTAFKIIDNGSAQSPIQNQRINSMLQNPREVNWFERQTGQTIEGNTTPEKRQSVYNILQQYEAQQNETPQLANPTVATRVVQKAEQMANYDGQNLPEEIRYTPTEYKVAEAMGLADPEIAPAVVQTGMSPEEVAKTRGQQQQGYIARHAETEAYRRAEEQAQDIPQAEPQRAAIDNQTESATIDQAEANEMAQSQNATLEGQEKAPAPAPKKVSSPTGQTWHQLPNVIEDSPNAAIQKSKDGSYTVHLNIDSSSGRFRVFDTLDEARAFFNSVNNANGMATSQAQTIEGQDAAPVPAPEKTEAPTATETAQGEEQGLTQAQTPENAQEPVKLEGNSQQEAQRKSVPSSDPEEAARAEKNEERRQADNAQINRAFNAKSPTTFQGTGPDPNATVTYDPNTRSLTVKDADGNVIDRITDLNKRRAKKELNKLRRTERTTKVAPEPVETKAEAEQTVQQAEPQQESPAGESETAQQIRAAESVEQLRTMFFEDPDSFAEAYEEVTGEKLNQYTAPDDIADLYDRMHGETQEAEAPAVEEEAETEETAPTLEQNLPEEQKPLRERIQSNAISDTELETMLGDRTSRNELAKALGITSTTRKNVEAGYRLYQLLNSELNARAEEVAKAEVLQQVKNGEIDSDDLRALIKSGKLTTEDVVSAIGRGGKDIRNLLGQYADYKNGLNPSSMTQADSKWLERANKKKAANAKTNEARKAAEAVSLEDQLKGEGVDEDNAGDALGGSDSTGSVERSAPVGSDDTGTAKGSNGRNVGTLFEPLTGRKYDAAEQALNEEYERRGISGPAKDSLETIRNDGIERRSKKKIYILASNKVSKPYKTLLKIANKYGRNFLTIMDASESTDVGESGFCHRSTSIFGPTFITHRYIPQSARSFTNLDGQSVSHEYAHDFGTVYAEEHDGNRPDYLEGLKSVTSDLVKTGIIQDDKQANVRNLLLRMYAQKVGPNAIRGYLYAKYKNQVNGREKFNEAFEAYAKLNGKDKVAYIKENLPDAYKTFTTTAREEIMMELCSEGQYFKTALQSAGYDIKPFGEAARSWLERDGGVPQGFFNEIAPVVEQLNQDNLKWLEEQDKVRGGNAAVTSSETDAGTLSEATDLRDAEIEDLRRRLAEAEARAEANAQPTAENPYAVNRYYPDGATDTRSNKRVSEMRTAGEKVHAGSVSYERVSKKQIADAAETNLRTFGYEHELKYFENTPPRHADALDIEEAAQLFTKLDVERSFRETHGGKARDTSLPADMDTLVSDAENLAQWVTEATGQAARVLCQTATLTPELKTLTNGRTTYLGNAEPGEVDPDSVGAKMYRIMDDHISYIQDIQERLDRKEISREEATKEMLHELHEINVVRNVKKVFGKLGERMERWEAKLLDRVAGSAQGYELLKAMAVGSVDRIASDFGTVGAINTVKQIRYLNLLSNFATKVNNILNNLESSTTGAISQNVGRVLTNRVATDILDGDVPLAKDYSWQHGIGWGKNKELNRYMIDKCAESVLSLYYNLDVDEGVVDVDLGKSTARFNQNDGTFGRLMARLQFLSGLGMQTTDAMAIARAEKGMELGIDELGLSEARREVMKQDAQQEARRRMYHGETKAAKAMLALRDAANTIQIPFTSDKTGKIGLGDIMMPFVQVPTNVAMRAMRSSPLGVLYGFGKYATGINALKRRANTANRVKALEEKRSKKVALTAEEMQFLNDNKGVKAPTDAEVRSLQRTLGESCTNAAIMVFAAGLSALGAIRDFDDEDDEDMKRLAREKGYTGLQINLSALLNGGKWNDDGDVVIGGNWLEVMALPVAAGYSIFHSYNEDTNGGADVFKAVAMSPFSSLTQLLDAAEEIPGIKQASEIWNAYENLQQYDSLDKRISKSWAGITQYAANTASSFVIPNLVAQFAAGRDNTVRDIYNADTSLEVAKNIIQNKVPWWRDQLPEAKSSLGETRKYGENKAMGLLNRMILPGTGVQVYRKSALEKEYEALGKSGNGNVAAKTSAPTAIKIDGQEWALNAEERRKYDEMYTPLVRQYHEQLISSDYYKELQAELKQEALQDTRSLAERLTKEYTLRNKEGCEAQIDFKNWERAVSNNPQKAVEFELAKMGAKACYTKEELTDFKAMDHYLDTEYKNLDPELKDVLDASYARLDSMADAREKTGMSSEQYETFRKLWKSYDDAVKDKTEDDESYSGFNRNLIVDIYDDPNATEAQKAWAADNFRLWMNTPAKLDSPQKIVKNTSLSWKEADEWLDLKANTKPAEGYKELPQNQRLMMVRDSSFPESKKWELIEVEASDSAWAKLKPFKDEGKSVAYALEHARWYKATRYSNYKEMRFDTIYPNA